MIEYLENNDLAICNGISFRKDKKTGYYLSSRPVYRNRRVRLHTYVWLQSKGEIPEGYAIHHLDKDKSNNDIDNLVCIPKNEHQKLHLRERIADDPDNYKARFIARTMDKAKQWHKSEEGHNWHIQHGIDVFRDIGFVERICEYCGNPYKVRKNCENTSRFCCNNCKAAFRRKSGVDNIERQCKYCGKLFVTNKYSTKKYCSCECRKHQRRK